MRNIPVDLSRYSAVVMEPPAMKMRKVNGQEEVAMDRDGTVLFVVSVALKAPEEAGEVLKVTLATDPTAQGEDFGFGSLVTLIEPTASPYSFKNDKGETVSGIAFRAKGLTLAS